MKIAKFFWKKMIVLVFSIIITWLVLLQNKHIYNNNASNLTQSQYFNQKSIGFFPCVYNELSTDEYANMVHDMIFAWSYAVKNNRTYIGSVLPYGQAFQKPTLTRLIKSLNITLEIGINQNAGLPFQPDKIVFKNCSLISNYKSEKFILENPFLIISKKTTIKSRGKRNVVVHINDKMDQQKYKQRQNYHGYISNSHTLYRLHQIIGANDQVSLLYNGKETLSDFTDLGYTVYYNMSELWKWETILKSDVFFMSRCSSSYVPALFSRGIVYYNEFWHKPQPHWLIQQNIFLGVNRTIKIIMKELVLPCSATEYGSNTVQMHVCTVSKKTTMYYEQFQHAALTVFPCWSWFAEKQAKTCAFLIKDGLFNKWFNTFLSQKMGCLIINQQPTQCAVIGTLVQKPKTGFGEQNHIWLSSYADAKTLQKLLSFKNVTNKDLGIIDREKTRRIQNVVDMNITNDIAYFETLSYSNQALWFHEHDFIIAAHGAALTNAVFIRKCTVIIQLYPDHYYRTTYYKQLLEIMGAVSISWIKHKYIGNNATLHEKNEKSLYKDFEVHRENLDYWRKKDIIIDKETMDKLIEIAKKKQEICRQQLPT